MLPPKILSQKILSHRDNSQEQRAKTADDHRCDGRKAKLSAAHAGVLAVCLPGITAVSASLRLAVGGEEFVEAGAQRQEVAPSFAFALRRAQQKRLMKHRQCRNRLAEAGDREVEPPAAQPRDALALRQQCPG